MNIKRCDRCGEEIEIRYNGDWLDALSEAAKRLGNTLTGKPNISLFNTNNGEELDLCKDCQKSLRAWMSEKHPEEHQEKNPPKIRKAYIIPEPETPNFEDLKFGD